MNPWTWPLTADSESFLKICTVMLGPGFGGAERYYVDLSVALARRGHEVLAISRAGEAAAARLEEIEGLDNLRRETIRILGKGKRDPFAPRKILRLVRRHGSQVIHSSLGGAARIASMASRRLGIPHVAAVHNFEKKMKRYRHADMLVPPTTILREYLLAKNIPPARIRVIPNFSTCAPAAAAHARERVTRIAAYGRFVPIKGFDLLLRSFSRLGRNDIHLYLGGDGEERRRLMKLAVALNLDERVHFVGWLDDVREFLLQADLFVLPSRVESFGIALLEAMACGIPIVATDCNGPREILDERAGWLCEADNEKALAAAMQDAIDRPEQRRRRARAALALFRERYAADKVMGEFENLYRETIRAAAAAKRPGNGHALPLRERSYGGWE